MLVLAIDIGGTAIKYGLVSQSGLVVAKATKTNCASSSNDLIDILKNIVDQINSSYVIDGIALTVPAITDPVSGMVLSEGSMPFLMGMSIKHALQELYDLPIHSENDGNCAALAEVWLGAGKDHNDLVAVVIGTGVGGAIIKNRMMHPGKQFISGEFGYFITDYDFKRNKFLSWSDAGGMYPLRKSMSDKLGYEVTGKDVFDMAEQGNEEAIDLIDGFYNCHAIGLFNIQYMYDPEVIILGGKVSERPDFISEIEKRMDKMFDTIEIATVRPKLKTARYGNDANLIGAVYHFMQHEGIL